MWESSHPNPDRGSEAPGRAARLCRLLLVSAPVLFAVVLAAASGLADPPGAPPPPSPPPVPPAAVDPEAAYRREWSRALDASLGPLPRDTTWFEQAAEARERFRFEAAAMYLLSRPDNPLGLAREERVRCLRLFQDLERDTALTAWSRLKLTSLLAEVEDFRPPPPTLQWLPRERVLRALPRTREALRRRAGGLRERPERPDVPSDQGPPDSSGDVAPAWLILHQLHQVLEARPLGRRQAAAMVAELERSERRLSSTQRTWGELDRLVRARPERAARIQEAAEELDLSAHLWDENDVASHGAVFLLVALGYGEDLPFGHTVQHLATCSLCRQGLGEPARRWSRGFGVDPDSFRSLEGTIEVFRDLPGRTPHDVRCLVGPPALQDGPEWVFFPPRHRVRLTFSPEGRVLAARVEERAPEESAAAPAGSAPPSLND